MAKVLSFSELQNLYMHFVDAALYAFPQIHLPQKAIAAAGTAQQAPDAFYCFALLEATGLVVVPGSGFGQKA